MQHDAPITIDLNADVGEGTEPHDIEREMAVMSFVTSVNIACGGHAGDDHSMRKTIRRAAEQSLAIGAHPSYPDRAGFGRVPMRLRPSELRASIRAQLTALLDLAREEGVSIVHCKPHGALYHAASMDESIARAVHQACMDVSVDLRLIGLAGSNAVAWWGDWGGTVLSEAFADRIYRPDGSLRPRNEPDALITDERQAADQACAIALSGSIRCETGEVVSLAADTLCIHADTPNAVRIASRVASSLQQRGINLCSPK